MVRGPYGLRLSPRVVLPVVSAAPCGASACRLKYVFRSYVRAVCLTQRLRDVWTETLHIIFVFVARYFRPTPPAEPTQQVDPTAGGGVARRRLAEVSLGRRKDRRRHVANRDAGKQRSRLL